MNLQFIGFKLSRKSEKKIFSITLNLNYQNFSEKLLTSFFNQLYIKSCNLYIVMILLLYVYLE